MRPGDFPKFIRACNADEAHEVLQGIFTGAPRLRVVNVGKPLDFGGDFGQATEITSSRPFSFRKTDPLGFFQDHSES